MKATAHASKEQEITVEGMTCTACAATVRHFLEEQGLQEVYVDLAAHKVSFRHVGQAVDPLQLKPGLAKLGYQLRTEDDKTTFFTLERKLVLSAVLTLPMFLDHLLHLVGGGIPGLHNPWVQLALTIPVYLVGFSHFGRSAWGAVRNRESNMDVLIFLGSSAAFVYSVIGLVLRDPSYYFFETSAMIITLVLLGNWMEKRALRSTTTALDALQQLKVETARLWMGGHQFMDIPASDLRKGDKVMVNHGESVPVDGEVLEGEGELNEAALTGESVPVQRRPGDPVLGGSLVVSGNFIIQASVHPADTLFQQIIRLVKAAQSERPPIQRLADRISAWFVPLVVLISIAAYFIGIFLLDVSTGKALMNAIAVLVISCPCAMGLATPTAITVGMGRMSRQGLLIKGSHTIEDLAAVRKILFDKTGTLTSGILQVRQIRTKMGLEAEVRQILYQIELRSSHPLARSIIQYLGNTRVLPELTLSEIREIPGTGMEAKDQQGRYYQLGRDEYDGGEGYHLALLRDGEKIGHVVLEDVLREDAAAAVATLRKRGYQCALVSGDHEDNVKRVAERVGMEEFYARQMPADKYRIIESMGQAGKLAMVGDGINDAPALEKADVGIAMAGATHSALQSAKVALLRPRLQDLIALFAISKLTVRTIRENLFWAFSYNVVAIPLAVMGLLNPMWGALFMAFSDLVVIGNSIRLKYRGRG